jgi:integrase
MNNNDRIPVGQNVTIFPRGKRKIWCAEFSRDGQHCRRSLKTGSKKVAVQRATKLSTELTEVIYCGAPRPVAVRDVSNDYIAYLETKGRARKTLVKYESTLNLFVTFLGERRVTKIAQFTEAHFDQFRAVRLSGHHPKTVYCESINIKQLMKWAKKRKIMKEAPVVDYEVEKPPHEQHACPTLELVNLILVALDAKRFPQVAILAFTGIRAGELQRLGPDDIDLTNRWIHIRSRRGAETKNRKSRKVPIHDRLLTILQTLPRQTRSFVFTEPPSDRYPNGDHQLNVKRLNELFQKVVKRLGLVTGRKHHGLVLHSLRHFFETICVNAGVPQRVVDNWMGHASDRSMASFYYSLSDDESQRFVKSVPFGSGTPPADGGNIGEAK